MKKTIIVVSFLLLVFSSRATHYYVKNGGSDGGAGTSDGAAWATASKVSGFTFSAGDTISFKCGDIWIEQLVIHNSGSAGNPIVYNSYGSGIAPLISGLVTVSAWTSLGSNLWQSTSAVSTIATLNMVTVNGNLQPIGRWPKLGTTHNGYLYIDSHSGATSITSAGLSGYPSFVGGEIVIRKEHWILDRETVATLSGTTVTFSNNNPAYPIQDNYGFFFQNHINACTAQGDWYYDASTKKITMYSVGSPSGVQVATIDTLINLNAKTYITFDGISFTGANSHGLYSGSTGASHLTISNCTFSLMGIDALKMNQSAATDHLSLTNSTISYINSDGIDGNEASYCTITNNVFKNIGMMAGMGLSGDAQYEGMAYIGSNSNVQYNDISSIGYIGIHYTGSDLTVQNNYFHDFCQTKDDCAAIYTYEGGTPGHGTNRQILNNIIINAGNSVVNDGTPGEAAGSAPQVYGMYFDGAASNCTAIGNTVGNSYGSGINSNGSQNVDIENNTVYNCRIASIQLVNWYAPDQNFSGLTIKHNIFFGKDSTQICWQSINLSGGASISAWGSIDNNYYCRPVYEPSSISLAYYGDGPGTIIDAEAGTFTQYSLDTWKTFSSIDTHSNKSPRTVNSTDSLRFEYNVLTGGILRSLGATYEDVVPNSYAGYITIPGYGSSALILTGAFTPSTALRIKKGNIKLIQQ